MPPSAAGTVPRENVALELLPKAALQLDHQQGMATQIEEIVIDSDSRVSQKILPDSGHFLFGARTWRRVRSRTDVPPSGAGRSLRSTLRFGVNGNASKRTTAEGIMYSGNLGRKASRHEPDSAASPRATT